MPANLLIFDADYVAELTAGMNVACELFAEAVSSLRSASSHENWKCKERARIIENFDELNTKLNSLDRGVNETTRILSGSVSRFAALESQYDSQANNLSEELTSNHGFSATVRTSGSQAGTSAAGSAGAAGAGALGSSTGRPGESAPAAGSRTPAGAGTRTGAGGLHINAGGRMFDRRQNGNINTGHDGSTMTGGGSMNVNLPVTHIPDNPGAAAKGTKHTQEIANAALNSVTDAITEALSAPNDRAKAAQLAQAYNAGRSIFESSAAILASPSQPHASERLAMAAGIVALSQNTAEHSTVSASASVNITQNAGQISSALEEDSDASELRDLLAALTGEETSSDGNFSGSESQGLSFFDMIISELKKAFSGGAENNSSASRTSIFSSSPVMEFLGNFVTDRAV